MPIVQAVNSDASAYNVSVGCANISGFTVTRVTGYFKAGIYLGRGAHHCNY